VWVAPTFAYAQETPKSAVEVADEAPADTQVPPEADAAQDNEGVDESTLANARETAIEGLAAYDQGLYREAVEKLTAAYETVKVPTLALYLARALAQQGQLVEALGYYEDASRLTVARGDLETQRRAQRDAQREREALVPRIPRLRIEVLGVSLAEVQLLIDGRPLGAVAPASLLSINPGWHQLSARRGSEVVVGDVQAQIGHEHTVVLDFARREQPPAPRPQARPVEPTMPQKADWRRPTAWTSLGIGALGAGVGVVSGLWALRLRGELTKNCPNRDCPADQQDELDQYRRLRPISTAGFVVGAAGLAAGVSLLLSEDEGERTGSTRLGLGLGGASLVGTF
jgi:tetratricopeptide (TPR) repeat protein